MSIYRAKSGALVFCTGSWRWAVGISRIRLNIIDGNGAIDIVSQQATLNLSKDFGVAPTTILNTVQNNNAAPLVDPGPAASPEAYSLNAQGTWGTPIK